MKTLSVGIMKGAADKSYNPSPPREGTKIRELYDLFMANKGRVIAVHRDNSTSKMIEVLMDIHGLDIRCIGNRLGKSCLVGEWFGSKYVDYIAALHIVGNSSPDGVRHQG